jgi:hypothetical protein
MVKGEILVNTNTIVVPLSTCLGAIATVDPAAMIMIAVYHEISR